MYSQRQIYAEPLEGSQFMHNPEVPAAPLHSLNNLLHEVGANKDKDAFMQLFDYFAPRIKSYLMKGGIHDDEADELAQETMLTVWQKADSYDPDRAAASTWIFTIARNKRIDFFRKEGRSIARPPEKFYNLKSEEETPFEKVYGQEVNEDVDQALQELSEEQVTMIKKAFYEDKPHSEIAAETGLPLGTVKSRIRLAMDKLRKALHEQKL